MMSDWKLGNPEEAGRYIVTLEGVTMECDWTGSKWYHPNLPLILFDEVTAWMEMPEPYLQTAK